MRKFILTVALLIVAPMAALADGGKVYKWIDKDGTIHYGDSVPVEYAELPKEVLNDHGVTVDNLEGKKSPEQIEAERIAEEKRVADALQRRADQALLATYTSVEEILMHRDRRVELFQAQSRVTELYLRNLERRLSSLEVTAANYQPYSADPDAPMVTEDLADDLQQTKETIERHEHNLRKFKSDEALIVSRFAGDITRFKVLKGID